tara:strand:- start:79 stop:480 length:402 start_codon:yes stop_codon:yes gene_type:complete
MKFKNPLKSAIQKYSSAKDEHLAYEKIANDMDKDNIDKGVWTKAFAKSEGNEIKQKAIYIELMIEHYQQEKEAKEELEYIASKESERNYSLYEQQSKIYNKQQQEKKHFDDVRKAKEKFIKQREEADRKLRER